MTSTPRHQSGRPRRTFTPARTGHSWQRALPRTRASGHRRATHPATLWPFADAEPLTGTALLAGWLGRTIVTLVTTYTRPGDRVLLLLSPAPVRVEPRPFSRARGEDAYAGLPEAVWTINRLGRTVDTATVAPSSDHSSDPTGPNSHSAGESGSRPGLGRLGLLSPIDPPHETEHQPGDATPRLRDAFDLIITAVRPGVTDWLGHADWDTTLTLTGLVAVLTHGDFGGGRLLDPIPAIVDTFRRRRLGWLDHIAVLHAALPSTVATDATASTGTAASARGAVPRSGVASPWPLRPVHHDLLLFGRLVSAAAGTYVTERQETSDV